MSLREKASASIGEFDYIVVGAGSGGCVVASRLSEDPSCRVLILEAGGRDRSPAVHIPAGLGSLLSKPGPYNWHGLTEPQAELGGRRMYWPTGRGWGGTSSINGMAYIRGQAEDYDDWAALGLTDWAYERVLPYFRRAEANSRGVSRYHGDDGPLRVSDTPTWMLLSQVFLDAGAAAGYPLNGDFNGASQEGFGPLQMTVHRGRRWSTARGYLRPALGRANLTVRNDALVSRLLIENGRITGVAWLRGNRVETARVRREMILCAGVTRTPQILMLSGIGDAMALSALGINVILDRPDVGRNLQDHVNITLKWECPLPVTLYAQTRPLAAAKTALHYLFCRKGLAQGIGTEAYAFVKSEPHFDRPDLQISFANALMDGADLNEMAIRRDGFTFNVWHLRPDSRGLITLRSSDPREHPMVQPRYLHAPKEREALRRGVSIVRNIVAQRPFERFRGAEVSPGMAVASDEAINAYLTDHATGLFHPVGSARMGCDGGAVVDTRLRVRGIAGLRIADASIFPSQISGNTNAAVVMIAERAAGFIRADN